MPQNLEMGNNQIMLSVIVCTHNRAELLQETLNSIFNQNTNFLMEVIVSDDCSTDNTVEMLKLMEKDHPMLHINVTPENYGPGGNWASAMKLVKGKYVAFLDDDDFWTEESRMQTMVDYLESNPTVDVVYTDGFTFKENGEKKYPMIWPREDFPKFQKMWRGEQPCISLDMIVAKTSVMNNSICYDDYIKLRFPAQDWSTNLLLLYHNARFSFLDQPSVAIRESHGSMSRSIDYNKIEHYFLQETRMNCYLDQLITGDSSISYDVDKQRLYHALINAAYKNSDWRRAKEYSKKSGEHTLRNYFSHTWLTFHFFRLVKKIKEHC